MLAFTDASSCSHKLRILCQRRQKELRTASLFKPHAARMTGTVLTSTDSLRTIDKTHVSH